MIQVLSMRTPRSKRSVKCLLVQAAINLLILTEVGCYQPAKELGRPKSCPESRRELLIQQGISSCLSISPDGKRIAGPATEDKELNILETRTGNRLLKMSFGITKINCLSYSPDGKMIACGLKSRAVLGNNNDFLLLIDSSTGAILKRLSGHLETVNQVAFSPNGKLLASASDDETIRLWNVATGRAMHILKGHSYSVLDVAFKSDGKQLVSVGDDEGIVRFWDVETGTQVNTLRDRTSGSFDRVAFQSGGMLLAASESKVKSDSLAMVHTIYVWDLRDTSKVVCLSGHTEVIRRLIFHPNGRHLYSLDNSGMIHIWDVFTRKQVMSFYIGWPGHDFALSRDGNRLVATCGDRQPTTVWNLQLTDKRER